MSDAKSSTGEIPREHKIEMGANMEKKIKEYVLSGFRTDEVQEYEIRNKAMARKAAAVTKGVQSMKGYGTTIKHLI